MRSFLAGILVTVGVLAVAGQVALPAYFEGRVEDRLERGGGDALVSIAAFPAHTLIAGRGTSFEARGSGLEFDVDDRRERPFERLDGFESVDVDVDDLTIGPLRVKRFELTRERRGDDYEMAVAAQVEPRAMAQELGAAAGGSLGGIAGSFAAGLIPEGFAAIPVKLDASVASADGRTDVIEARGSVAGLPAGSVAEMVLAAVLQQL